MTTKCDIIRDTVTALTCGLCPRGCHAQSDCRPGQVCSGGACVGRPTGCPAGLSPAVCGVTNTANNRMALFADRYSLASLFASAGDKAQLALEEKDYVTGIQATELALAAAYPTASSPATNISWPDFEECLWSPAGTPSGAFGNTYFGRADLQTFGMAPTYPLGGSLAQGSIWKPPAVSPLPAFVDYAANPDLAAILIFAFLVLVLAALLFRAWRDARATASRSAAPPEAGYPDGAPLDDYWAQYD